MMNRLCKVLVVGLLLGLAQEMGAQTYEQFVEKSFDLLDQNDLLAAGESLKAALRLEPANPNNYALLMNLGTIQRRQGLLEEALVSYSAALSRYPQRSCRTGRSFIRRWARSRRH